ncbi:unnamed protein product [Leuciscus chuanchicus]
MSAQNDFYCKKLRSSDIIRVNLEDFTFIMSEIEEAQNDFYCKKLKSSHIIRVNLEDVTFIMSEIEEGIFVEKRQQSIITSTKDNDGTHSLSALTAQNQTTQLNWALRLHGLTRQSPSPAKPATRLMWKSQYVPYDGIPFVNAGRRAIVMECQFGPRRKGVQPKKGSEQETNQNIFYKAKTAHLYHDADTANLPPLPEQICFAEEEQNEDEEETEELDSEAMQDVTMEDGASLASRLHPLVAEKICELVAQGHNQVYTVRKQLRYDSDGFKSPLFYLLEKYLPLLCERPGRRFVEHEMFKSEEVPERHSPCYFPTVNDIKNHIHEAQKALQLTAGPLATSDTENMFWKAEANNLLPETVTLTPATVDVSPQKEGLLEESDTLSPEAVQLFSSLTSLQPKIFAHLQAIQIQPALCPVEDTAQPTPPPPPEAPELSSPAPPQPVLLCPSQFLQSSGSAGESISLCDPPDPARHEPAGECDLSD